jgi:CheY-specific phosphatase CheX
MQFQLDMESVIGASTQFWEQMLSMTLQPAPIRCDVGAGERCLVGSVCITGAWAGRIEVRMTEKLAWTATAAMLMIPVETVSEADAMDATREIANMVAGTIKSSLPRPCTMTVPDAVIAPGNLCGDPSLDNMLSVGLDHSEGRLIVRIREQECKQPETESPHAELHAASTAPKEARAMIPLCPVLMPA